MNKALSGLQDENRLWKISFIPVFRKTVLIIQCSQKGGLIHNTKTITETFTVDSCRIQALIIVGFISECKSSKSENIISQTRNSYSVS